MTIQMWQWHGELTTKTGLCIRLRFQAGMFWFYKKKKIHLYIYTLWKWRASLSKRSGQPSTLTFLRPHSLKPCSWRVSEPESLSARRARETHPGAQILWVVGWVTPSARETKRSFLGAVVQREQPERWLGAHQWPPCRCYRCDSIQVPHSLLMAEWAQLQPKAARMRCLLSWHCHGQLLLSLVFLALDQTNFESPWERPSASALKPVASQVTDGIKKQEVASGQLCPGNKLQVGVNTHVLGMSKGTDIWKVISFGSCYFPKLIINNGNQGGPKRLRCSS